MPRIFARLLSEAVHAVCVAAARPNFMKVKPVLDALEACGAATSLVHAGQHYDPDVNDVFFADLGLRPPDHHLGSGSGSQATQTARVMTAFEPLLDRLAPDVVVVVGDVTATLAVALVTAKSPARLAHVEAGLRSGNREMPEEVNRLVVDRLSDDLFAPFVQIDERSNDKHAGSGLGLALVKHYTQALGGRVEVESEVGVGSTFTVLLPRRPIKLAVDGAMMISVN